MRLRLKLLRIILRNCKPLFFIPIIIAYCLLPGVSAIKYFYVDPSEARSTFIYMAQVFIRRSPPTGSCSAASLTRRFCRSQTASTRF